MDKDGKNPNNVWRTGDRTFYKAMDWKEPRMIFTCSMSDFFIEEADQWREDAWNIIRATPQHTWQILTKRPERIKECLPEDWGEGWDNVWLGVSVESQKYFERAAVLADIPAKTRFISAEPLLSELDVLQEIDGKRIIDDFQWIILGGESGNDWGKYRYRECKFDWLYKIIDDARREATHVAMFVKQTGTFISKKQRYKDWHGGQYD